MGPIIFDATDDIDLLPESAWEWLHSRFWVCQYRKGREDMDSRYPTWCMSQARPAPVPNPEMAWRRPTYLEAMERWAWERKNGEPYKWSKPEYARSRVTECLACSHPEWAHKTGPCSQLFTRCSCRAFVQEVG